MKDLEKKKREMRGWYKKLLMELGKHGISEGCFLTEGNNGMTMMVCLGVRPNTRRFDTRLQNMVVKTPYGAIPRMVLEIMDDVSGEGNLKLESFVNPWRKEDRELWLKMEKQGVLPILFIDRNGSSPETFYIFIEKTRGSWRKTLDLTDQYNEKVKNNSFDDAKKWIIENIPL